MNPTKLPELKRIEDLVSIWDLDMEQEYLVEGLLPENSLILLTGESGCGKSTVILSLAHAVATGTPFLGRACEKRKVLFVDGENGLYVYHERFRRLNIPENPDMYFWGLWNSPEPTGPSHKALIRFALDNRPLIIFDSLIAFHPGSEQDSSETRSYMNQFRLLANAGATVVVIHHIGKGENTKEYRGSSDIKASVDAGYLLTAKKPLLTLMELKPYKSREGALEPINFGLIDGQFKLLSIKHKAWGVVVDNIRKNPGLIQQELIKMLPSESVYAIRNILDQGVADGTLHTEKGEKHSLKYYPGVS